MPSIIVALLLISVLISICFVLVSVNNKHRRKAAAEIVSLFNKLGQEKNLSFSKKEIEETFIMGLDEECKKLLAIERTDDGYLSLVVDLEHLRGCSKKKIYKSINMGTIKKEKFETLVDKIVLQLDHIDKREPIQISFYEARRDPPGHMTDLAKKAGNWESILTKTINNKIRSSA